MASNLDRSLDEIVATRPRNNCRRGNKAPVTGGIRKRPQRAAAPKANSPNRTKAAGLPKTSKIIVSNLPYDVKQKEVKEYFQSVAGPVRQATLTYGPDGRSRGVATVEFISPERAATAVQNINGVEIDKRRVKVEFVVDPNASSTFAYRVGAPYKIGRPSPQGPKALFKSAEEPAVTRHRAKTFGGKRGGRAGSGQGKLKTTEELDQEMVDYFGGDVGMEDTVL